MTQMMEARKGVVTDAIRTVAKREKRDVEFIRERVADGRIVIPANIHHTHLVPCGIGRELFTKVNANIGNSMLTSGPEQEHVKLKSVLRYGADTVMDLSTGDDIIPIRSALIDQSPIPVGTVPVYEMVAREGRAGLCEKLVLQVIEEQAKQGVDYITIHAGLLKRYVPMAMKRKLGIVSRGGALLAAWMYEHNHENPFYTAFDQILEICKEHDVTLSLGDGLRPGSLADASDEAQFAELDTLGELVRRSREAGVQAMVEGPGHVPLDEIQMNMEREQKVCDDAPFYILGPVVTDIAPGYDHFVAAMGGAMGAYHGAAMLCYVTPKEHIGLPNDDDVRRGIIAFRIAAHVADVGLHKPDARKWDDEMSDARAVFNWDRQFELAIDPEHTRTLHDESIRESGKPDLHGTPYCTMCGPEFCSVRLFSALTKAMKENPPEK